MSAEEPVLVAEPLVGTVDILVLGSFIGLIIYWFCFRKKKNDIPKNLNFVATSNNSYVVDDTGFVSKMKKGGKSIAIFYGSQTGTAEEFAGRLAKDSHRYGLKALVLDPEECDMEELAKLGDIEHSLVIFCVATYGEGDPTDNAQGLYEWLQEDRNDLENVNYAVFGLGNKTYEHFNSMGKFVDEKLEEMGATRIYEQGEGDDDGNIEEDFVRWREGFWPSVLKHFGIKVRDVRRRLSTCLEREYRLVLHKELLQDKVFNGEISKLGSFKNQKPLYDAKNPFLSKISVNRELHKAGDRSCMHIELDITGSKIRYEAGDHVGIYPTNDPELVEKMGKLLGTDLDTVISLDNMDEDASKKHPFPCPTTYRTALLHYVDITSTVKTNMLTELQEYAREKDREFLLRICDTTEEAKKEYNEWIVKDSRNIVAVLEDLPSFRPPLDHILELLPRLQCRYYSISSSPKLHPNHIHVTAVVVNWLARTGRKMNGVATTMLSHKIPTDVDVHVVPIFVRKTTFRLPFKPIIPVIMIGPGTGLAPFRGFIQEKHHQKQQGKETGETVLYFGCRKRSEDFLYEDELNSYVNDKTLTQIHLAFSRDQNEKVYVQNLMENNRAEIWDILQKGGHIYVCGDARNMAREVHNLVVDIAKVSGNMSTAGANDYVKKLSNKGRYSVDVWS